MSVVLNSAYWEYIDKAKRFGSVLSGFQELGFITESPRLHHPIYSTLAVQHRMIDKKNPAYLKAHGERDQLAVAQSNN